VFQLPISLTENAPAGGTTVTLSASPAPHTSTKGVGQDYTLSATSCVILDGAKTPATPVTLTVVNRTYVGQDKLVTITLSNEDGIGFVKSTLKVNIVDDAREALIDVTNPGYGLSACAVDGVTNDRVNFQAILDYVKDNFNNGVVKVPAGRTVAILPNGYATVKMPCNQQVTICGDASDGYTKTASIKILQYDDAFHFFTANTAQVTSTYYWTHLTDASPGFVLENITIDGNGPNQVNWGNVAREQCYTFCLMANRGATKENAGRLLFILDNVTLKDTLSDGATILQNVDVRANNILTQNCYRGGLTSGGGYSVVDVSSSVIESPRDRTQIVDVASLQAEFSTGQEGYNNSRRCDWTIASTTVEAQFDLAWGVTDEDDADGSVINIDGLTQVERTGYGGWDFVVKNAVVTVDDSTLLSKDAGNLVVMPSDVTFTNVTVKVTPNADGTTPRGCVNVRWNHPSGDAISNKTLTFATCTFTTVDSLAASTDYTCAIYSDFQELNTNNNTLSITGGTVTNRLKYFLGLAASPVMGLPIISIDGTDSQCDKAGGYHFEWRTQATTLASTLTLANMTIDSGQYMRVTIASGGTLNHTSVIVSKAANVIHSTHWGFHYAATSYLTFTGQRIVRAPEGDNDAPGVNTHGIQFGDVDEYQCDNGNGAKYDCTQTAYYDESSSAEHDGVWTAQ
jgi:hypothetical protein